MKITLAALVIVAVLAGWAALLARLHWRMTP